MWIKICGITRPVDALTVMQSGANAVGLNFFSGSKRYVTPDAASALVQIIRDSESTAASSSDVTGCDSARQRTEIIGVFVNSAPRSVAETVHKAGLTGVQFHGDEPIDEIAEFHRLMPAVPLIRAFRVHPENIRETLTAVRGLQAEIPLRAVLLDALVAGEYGGTGHRVDSTVIQLYQSDPHLPPLILAGGLTAANVAAVAAELRPWGLDTASGVESAPGIKDQAQVLAFTAAARSVDADL